MQNYHQMIFTNELGGGEIVALQLAADLQRKPGLHNLWIPARGPATTAAEEKGLAWQNSQLGDVLTDSKFESARSNWRIWRLLHSTSPGVLHLHSPCHYGALSVGMQMSKVKRIVHVHLELEKDVLKWAFRRPPEVIMTCARFLVDYVRNSLPEKKQDNQKIVCVPNAIDISRFSPGDKHAARRQLGIPFNEFVVLMVANLATHKGQETALRTVAILKQKIYPLLFGWPA